MKQCNKCGRLLDKSEFYKNKSNKDGLHSWCKDCVKDYGKEYNARPETKLLKKNYMKEYSSKPEVAQRMKEYDKKREATKERKEYNKKFHEKYDKIPEIAKRRKEYRDNYLSIIENRVRASVRTAIPFRIGECWENNILPYSVKDLMNHLESLFDSFMTWDNYGDYWEIDHIIPKSQFNFSSPEDKNFKICWSFRNIRPLEVSNNRSRPRDGSDVPEFIRKSILEG